MIFKLYCTLSGDLPPSLLNLIPIDVLTKIKLYTADVVFRMFSLSVCDESFNF
jgi:hypothetical protein